MKVNALFLLLSLIFAPAFSWAGAEAHDSCRKLCDNEADCLRRCVSHVELFELTPSFVDLVTDFHPSVEVRMKVLRSGASREILPLCKETGWNIDNVISCLRSYPTPAVIKACKKISPKEEEQVRCLRSGNNSAQVESCSEFGATTAEHLECLGYQADLHVSRRCRSPEKSSRAERIQCMEQAKAEKEREAREFEAEVRRRVAAEEAEKKNHRGESRVPASTQRR